MLQAESDGDSCHQSASPGKRTGRIQPRSGHGGLVNKKLPLRFGSTNILFNVKLITSLWLWTWFTCKWGKHESVVRPLSPLKVILAKALVS